MGLDVDAYRGLTPLQTRECTGEEGCPCPGCDCSGDVRGFHPNPDFPGREGSLAGGHYRFADQVHVWSSSYSGHSLKRAQLAKMVGYQAEAHGEWRVPESGPFVEMIHFTDCDGVIGPELCAKLAKDFQEHRTQALEIGGSFYEWYEAYRKGFEFASDGGAVGFH